MATVPRFIDRARRAEAQSSFSAIIRALALGEPLAEAFPTDVMEASQAAAQRTPLTGPHLAVAGIPLGYFLRDLSATGGASSGGAIVGSARLDPQQSLRPYSLTVEAGLRVVQVPQGSGAPGVPAVSTPPTAGWVAAEGEAVPTSDAVFGLASPVPRRVGLTFDVSWRLVTQGGELFDTLVRVEAAVAIGRAIDKAVLQGAGSSGEPQGLATHGSVTEVAGASLDHADLLAMRKACVLGGAREDRLTWVAPAAVQETLSGRERATGGGRFLWDDGTVLGRPAVATDAAPATTLIVGDFSQAAFYAHGGVDLLVDRRHLSTGGRVRVVASMFGDVAINRPGVFARAVSVS